MYDLPGCIIFFYVFSLKAQFSKKEKILIQNACFDFLYNFVWNIFHLRRTEQDTIINVYRSSRKVPVTLTSFQWNFNFRDRILENTQVPKFHENSSSGSRVFPCGRTWADFADEPKNSAGQTERQTERRICPLLYELNYHTLSKGSNTVSSNNYFFPSLLQPDIILLTMKYKTLYQVGSLLTSKKEQ